MKTSNLQRLSVITLAGLALAALAPTVASASQVAQFAQQNSGSNLFVFTNNGSSAGVDSVTVPIVLTFDASTPNSTGNASIDGLMTITGVASGPAVQVVPGYYTQGFTSLDVTVTQQSAGYGQLAGATIFTADSTNDSLDVDPILGGLGNTATLQASYTGADVTLASPYINSGLISADQGFSLAVSNVTPNISIASDGYLNAFTGAVTGTFSATPSVPEPSPALAIGIAALGLTGLVLGRRNKSSVIG